MIDKILLTGGNGRLGTELRRLIPGLIAPRSAEMDITDPDSVTACLDAVRPDVIVHAAAYTDVAGAETDRARCRAVNVDGTRHVAMRATARNILLVHISTDYVFDGARGDYREDDPTGPVRNYYALTKLIAEDVARTVPAHLIIRTSFRPREWPYPKAFTDVFTSQDYVDVIAPDIALAVTRCREIDVRTLHIATERKSVFELARRRKPDVAPGSKKDVAVALPDDISLNIGAWINIKKLLMK